MAMVEALLLYKPLWDFSAPSLIILQMKCSSCGLSSPAIMFTFLQAVRRLTTNSKDRFCKLNTLSYILLTRL